ncbi:MAG: AbrB/MazE/SpoVT family DNA-binding domain-containing protein [Candidatus Doudnabacteria bacterium]|nr:AbrB/MazE/SpoVT family DNA-binding domain-containing protein [Candidatus Doudnabacteria bacterium]
MPIVTVKNKYQVVIPQTLRQQIGVNIGDLMEAKVEKGKITFTPKTLVDSLESRIAESMADYKAGRSYGPFETADELIASLKGMLKKRAAFKKKHKIL